MSLVAWRQFERSPTRRSIREDWLRLLADATLTEPAYLAFLQEHAGFFFCQNWNCEDLVISELRLGADWRTDFVSVRSERSYGFVYELIEIESPHSAPYTQGDVPSARLTKALQQIRDWKAWIADNGAEVRRLFPSKRSRVTGDLHFEYTVIIGRRDANVDQNRRNQLSEAESVQIRSFDYLTDLFDRRHFRSFTNPSRDFHVIDRDQDNQFTNPFYRAYSDRQWREIISHPTFEVVNMVTANIKQLLANRQYNDGRLSAFRDYLDTLPPEERMPHPREYELAGYKIDP